MDLVFIPVEQMLMSVHQKGGDRTYMRGLFLYMANWLLYDISQQS